MSWRCPECEEEIDHLRYEIPIQGTEWGTVSLANNKEINRHDIIGDHECDDSNSEWDGDDSYACPECDAGLLLKDLIWIGDEEDEEGADENEGIEENPKAEVKILWKKFRETTYDDMEDKMIETSHICPKCKYLFPKDIKEENYRFDEETIKQRENTIIECPKCRKTFTNKEETTKKDKLIRGNKQLIKVETKYKKPNVKRI